MAKVENVTQDSQKQIMSIDDQYIAKKRRRRIITNSIILSLTLILGIAIILLSCLKIDLKPKFDSNPDYVVIVTDKNNNYLYIDKSDEIYDEFLNIYNNSLSTSILTSLFTGNFYGYEIQYLDSGEKNPAKFYTSYNNGVGTELSLTLLGYLGSNYVKMAFTENQTLYLSNGDKLMGRYNKTKDIYYKDVCFTISSDENSTQIDFYFGVIDYMSYPTLVKISVEANSYDLYKFATER